MKLAMSHVVPDLVQKIVKGQDPLHILGDGNQVRHYTYGGDLARGIVDCDGAPDAASTRTSTSRPPSRPRVLELAEVIWRKIKGADVPFRCVVRRRRSSTTCRSACPTSTKATRGARLRGHHDRSTTMLDEVIPWVTQAVKDGRL